MEEAVESVRTKKRSFRLRWSLRVFFVLIALVAVGIGWLSYYMRIGYLHEDVAAKISESRGRVSWKLHRTAPLSPPSQNAAGGVVYSFMTREIKGGPPWMRNLGLEPAFQRIETVYLFTAFGEEKMAVAAREIARLDRIGSLYVKGDGFSEEHLALMLSGMQIDRLTVPYANISPGELPWLRNTNLEMLILSGTGFSNAAIDDLPETLKWADLSGTNIDDAGLEKFVRLKELKGLRLNGTSTTLPAIEELREKMPWCEIEWNPQVRP